MAFLQGLDVGIIESFFQLNRRVPETSETKMVAFSFIIICLFLISIPYILFKFLSADADFTLLSKRRVKREEIEDKVIWITGASRGIGEVLAKQLASLGAKLILSARNKEELERKTAVLDVPEESLKMSSAAGKTPAPGQAVYSASKFALNGYFHSLRSELCQKGIKVTVVCPGPIETSKGSASGSATKISSEKRVPEERCVELTLIAASHGLKEAWISYQEPHASDDEHPGFFNLPSLDIDPTPNIEFGSQVVDPPLPQSQDRFTQVYSRRNKAILPPSQQAPSSNHDLELTDTPNEGTLSAPPSPIHDITNLDLDIPIALRKNTRECTKRPLYPIAHSGCPGKGVLFKRGNKLTIEAFTDADYASSVSDRRSTSGYCVLIGGNLVSWRSKKQNVVARSSAESEFRALAQGMCELLWVGAKRVEAAANKGNTYSLGLLFGKKKKT
ncbi:hypothetical protein V2J09_022892 [Rumex salicifolius]